MYSKCESMYVWIGVLSVYVCAQVCTCEVYNKVCMCLSGCVYNICGRGGELMFNQHYCMVQKAWLDNETTSCQKTVRVENELTQKKHLKS